MKQAIYFYPRQDLMNKQQSNLKWIEEFHNEMRFATYYAESTTKNYFESLKRFVHHFNKLHPHISILHASETQIGLVYRHIIKNVSYYNSFKISIALRKFYQFLLVNRVIKKALDEEIKLQKPKLTQLPKYISEAKMNKCIDLAALKCMPQNTNVSTVSSKDALARRNYAILQLLYATGIRISELIHIKIQDIDLKNNTLRVMGKGNKERLVVFYDEARDAIENYLHIAYPVLVKARSNDGYLFVSQAHCLTHSSIKPITQISINRMIKKFGKQIGVKELSAHWFRHSFATHMLNGDANIRIIQELLGHSHLSSTSVYLHTTTKDLQKTHKTHHPRSKKCHKPKK